MFGSDDETLPEWKRLATEFGRLHGESPQIRLHAERCGELREERGMELSRTLPTVRLFDGYGGCLWWFDIGEDSADEFLKLVDAAGNLMSRTKSRMKLVAEGQWTRVEHGFRELSPTAQWFRELFGEARTAGDTEATPRGDCLLDAIKSSQLVCSERSDSALAFRKLKRRIEDEYTVKAWHDRRPPFRLDNDSLNDWYPKPTPDITSVRPSVPFATIADELWQCWKSVLYGVEARLLKLDTNTKRADWLTNTYRPELCGCLKRVYAALPYDADLADCAPEHRPALRGLNQLVNRLWRDYAPFDNRNPERILAKADEARFGEMVATFDRIRSQIEPPASIAAGEATEADGQVANEQESESLVRGEKPNGTQSTEAAFVFRPVRNGYELRWRGESGHVPANRAIGLHDFYQVVNLRSPIPLDELGAGPKVNDPHSKQLIATGADLSRMEKEGRRLMADIEVAESDLERCELQTKVDDLTTAIKAMKGLNGKPRDMNNHLDKIRPKVLDRKKTAVARIREHGLPDLADHFDLAINTKEGCLVYEPAFEVTWDTSPIEK